jgi:uncharacterized membrane protein YoaK (UPF0700 family)
MAALVFLTFASGVADAVSYVGLGRVFVANATGNVVFLGFAAAGAQQLSVLASLVALAGFLLGALAGGRIGEQLSADRRRWLTTALGVELTLVAVATVIAIVAGHGGDRRYLLIAPLGFALGVQNATVRRLAVPDMTTTVLTLTLTGLAADSRLAGGADVRWQRRAGSVALMLGGALVGALLVLHVGMPVALGVLLVAVAAAALCVSGSLGKRTS